MKNLNCSHLDLGLNSSSNQHVSPQNFFGSIKSTLNWNNIPTVWSRVLNSRTEITPSPLMSNILKADSYSLTCSNVKVTGMSGLSRLKIVCSLLVLSLADGVLERVQGVLLWDLIKWFLMGGPFLGLFCKNITQVNSKLRHLNVSFNFTWTKILPVWQCIVHKWRNNLI